MSILYWGQGIEDFKMSLKSCYQNENAAGALREESNLDEFRIKLTTQRTEVRLVVLAPASADELMDLFELNPLLSGIPIILLLPPCSYDTLMLAHRFHPRFVATTHGALPHAATVAVNIFKYRKGEKQ